jgi:hypothetical protein
MITNFAQANPESIRIQLRAENNNQVSMSAGRPLNAVTTTSLIFSIPCHAVYTVARNQPDTQGMPYETRR